MKLLTAAEMQELDRLTIEEVGIPGIVLMENAGRGAADLFHRRFADLFPGPVLVLAGKGNNGGDGYVIARHLLNRGWQVRTLVLAEKEAVSGDAGTNLQALLNCGGRVDFAPDDEAFSRCVAGQEAVVAAVDALLGTGLSSEVRGVYARAIAWLNAADRSVMAVDIPSGIDGSSGRVLGQAVRADLTATFAFAKVGHAVFPGAGWCGELAVVDIGIPAVIASRSPDRRVLVEAAEAQALLPERPLTGHKGTFGHLLVLAGSTGKSGAAAMTAEGALRAGSGLVTVACPAGIHGILETKLTEPMTVPLPEVDGGLSLQGLEQVRALWEDKTALALGPGLGPGEETRALVRRVVRECPLPLVVDADGLNSLAGALDILRERPGPTVLTPHPGEMARLLGSGVAEVEENRLEVAREFAVRHQVVLVLKGARTVTALADGRVRLNASGNPALASGGTGDVLTGLVAGLLAQGVASGEAAVLGVYLHGRAADRLQAELGDAGMTAGDLLRAIPAARRELAAPSRS